MNGNNQTTVAMTIHPLHCTSFTVGAAPAAPTPMMMSQPQQGGGQQSLRKSRYIPRSFVQHSYHDRSNELPDCTPSITRGGIATLFPTKLHAAIDRMTADGLGHVCSWQPHGRAFVVHDAKEFEAVMPTYFGKMKMASFQRQLNLYGFMRLTIGPDKGGYYNELFLQHRFFLSRKIHRIRVKGNGARSATNPDAEPNFYAMPPVAPMMPQQMPQQMMAAPQPMTASLPFMPETSLSSAPTRSIGPRQVSLNERDLLQSLQTPAQRPPKKATSKHDSDDDEEEELDESTFWASMEALMENMDVSDANNLSEKDEKDMAELGDIIEPEPLPSTPPERSLSPRPSEVLSSEEAATTDIMDLEVTAFLEAMFEKEEPPAPVATATGSVITKGPQLKKGISMAGGSANAVAYKSRDAFRRRRSTVNAAA